MYHEIQKLSRDVLNISQIADYLGLNWRTVKKQLEMDEHEFESYLESNDNRPKQLHAYEHFVKTKLEAFPDSSAAQVHDWLKEYDANFPKVHSKTVYNFVMGVRQKFNIPKVKATREFFVVEELPMGMQAQVDFGEYNMRCRNGKTKKVYFMAVVLSRSRYKHVYFSPVPFTSSLAVLAHEKAFGFFEGIPRELVYDQDKVFLTAENAGNLALTQVFKAYVEKRKFDTYFCRKADPQSKGKVENVVKYVK